MVRRSSAEELTFQLEVLDGVFNGEDFGITFEGFFVVEFQLNRIGFASFREVFYFHEHDVVATFLELMLTRGNIVALNLAHLHFPVFMDHFVQFDFVSDFFHGRTDEFDGILAAVLQGEEAAGHFFARDDFLNEAV